MNGSVAASQASADVGHLEGETNLLGRESRMQVSKGFDWFLLNISELIWLAAATAFALCTLFSFAFSFLTFPVLGSDASCVLKVSRSSQVQMTIQRGSQVRKSPHAASYRRTKRTRKSTWVIS